MPYVIAGYGYDSGARNHHRYGGYVLPSAENQRNSS
jgi:hypothetical protein